MVYASVAKRLHQLSSCCHHHHQEHLVSLYSQLRERQNGEQMELVRSTLVRWGRISILRSIQATAFHADARNPIEIHLRRVDKKKKNREERHNTCFTRRSKERVAVAQLIVEKFNEAKQHKLSRFFGIFNTVLERGFKFF